MNACSERVYFRLYAGLMVKEQSWLQIYPWVRWQSATSLPVFVEGQVFVPTTLMLEQVRRYGVYVVMYAL